MIEKTKSYIRTLFHPEKTEQESQEQQTFGLRNKTKDVMGTTEKNAFNPFLKKDGNLVNPLLNYQKLLDNPNISQKAKNYITQATGLTPTTTTVTTEQNTVTPTNITPTTAQEGNTVTPTPTTSVSSTQSVGASDNSIASAAQKYLGTPYVWGGESMDEGGMDCSGFVYNALKDAGYGVGRTTAQGYRSKGTVVSKADMQPGDLIFFGKNDNASHIGIYLGNGQMIHSSGGSKNTKSNPGKGVSITNVDYRSDFLEARRY